MMVSGPRSSCEAKSRNSPLSFSRVSIRRACSRRRSSRSRVKARRYSSECLRSVTSWHVPANRTGRPDSMRTTRPNVWRFLIAPSGPTIRCSTFEVEHRMVGPDGAIRNLQTFGRVVRIESGRPVRLAGTCQDVTERKHSEEYLLALTREREDRLREHARRMETLEKLKGEFLLLASHELRGPLTIITGYISLMRDGALGPLPEVVQAALPVMATQSAAMKQLISEMLETARLEHGLQLELRPLDLREMMLEAVQSVTPLLGAQQRLSTGAMSETVPILGDRERLLAIITNLLDNAIKYSGPRGEIACEVAVRGSWDSTVIS